MVRKTVTTQKAQSFRIESVEHSSALVTDSGLLSCLLGKARAEWRPDRQSVSRLSGAWHPALEMFPMCLSDLPDILVDTVRFKFNLGSEQYV
jgi:hypothetical protein